MKSTNALHRYRLESSLSCVQVADRCRPKASFGEKKGRSARDVTAATLNKIFTANRSARGCEEPRDKRDTYYTSLRPFNRAD